MATTTDLLDRLDQQWNAGKEAELKLLLNAVPVTMPELAVELCAADLEWRWRRHGKTATTAGLATEGRLPLTPLASDYLPYLAKWPIAAAGQQSLTAAEWIARSLWGDMPDVDAFANIASAAAADGTTDDWADSLAQQLHAVSPLVVDWSLVGDPAPPLCVPVAHRFTIGRQAADEPLPPAWVTDSQRLLIAGLRQRDISRNQLQVRRTRLDEVELTNLSKVVSGRYAGQVLEPGQRMRKTLPLKLAISNCQLQLHRQHA